MCTGSDRHQPSSVSRAGGRQHLSPVVSRLRSILITYLATVKTLAIRGTAEEIMVSRRDALKRSLGNNSGKLPNLADDGTMRDFIAVRFSQRPHCPRFC